MQRQLWPLAMRSEIAVKILTAVGLMLVLCQCDAAGKTENGIMAYQETLQETVAQGMVVPGSAEEATAITRFSDFISVMSPASAREKTAQVRPGQMGSMVAGEVMIGMAIVSMRRWPPGAVGAEGGHSVGSS